MHWSQILSLRSKIVCCYSFQETADAAANCCSDRRNSLRSVNVSTDRRKRGFCKSRSTSSLVRRNCVAGAAITQVCSGKRVCHLATRKRNLLCIFYYSKNSHKRTYEFRFRLILFLYIGSFLQYQLDVLKVFLKLFLETIYCVYY